MTMGEACGTEMTTIHWREQSSALHEAVIALADGREVYAGYVARTPPRSVWRGYVGALFEPVGMGPLEIMKAAVEQRVREVGTAEAVGRGACGGRGERGERTCG